MKRSEIRGCFVAREKSRLRCAPSGLRLLLKGLIMRGLLTIAMFALLANGAFAQVERQKVQTEKLHVVANTTPPDAFLSLRTEPSPRAGERIVAMPNGTVLKVLQQNPGGWWKVRVV